MLVGWMKFYGDDGLRGVDGLMERILHSRLRRGFLWRLKEGMS